jgi:hypothetical protein
MAMLNVKSAKREHNERWNFRGALFKWAKLQSWMFLKNIFKTLLHSLCSPGIREKVKWSLAWSVDKRKSKQI